MEIPKPVSASSEGQRTASACPVCGNTGLDLYRDDKTERDLMASELGSSRRSVHHGRIMRCRMCGFGFRSYRPSEEELASLYRDLDPAVYENESAGRLRTAARHLAIVRKYVTHGRLLDVGCASGSFLSCAADLGFEVEGVEPSSVLWAKANERLRGRGRVLSCTLQDAGFSKSSMDVLTLWDVLEHVPEPIEFLQLCASLVKPGGHVVANVPDLESWQARMLSGRWPLLLAEHLNYFSRRSLTLAGEASGLQVIRFGRRPASFSLEYVLYRLAQHKFPGSAAAYRLVAGRALGAVSIPAYLGESYVVWKRVG